MKKIVVKGVITVFIVLICSGLILVISSSFLGHVGDVSRQVFINSGKSDKSHICSFCKNKSTLDREKCQNNFIV